MTCAKYARLWIPRRSRFEEDDISSLLSQADRYEEHVFGQSTLGMEAHASSLPIMYAQTYNTALTMCAQDIFMLFLSAVIQCVSTIGGDTTISGGEEEGRPAQRLINSQMEKFASAFQSSGLGSLEDAYMCIVPVLAANRKLPPIGVFYQLLGAAMDGNEHKVDELIASGQVDVNAADDNGRTALSWAAQAGHANVVRSLLRGPGENINNFQGADVNVRDKTYDRTPLMWAADRGHAEVVRILLEAGGLNSIHATDKSGSTALILAENKTHAPVVKLLLESELVDLRTVDERRRTTLMWAARGGQAKVLSKILRGKPDVNAVDSDGNSALHHAVMDLQFSDDPENVVKSLLAEPDVMINLRNHAMASPIETLFSDKADSDTGLAVLNIFLQDPNLDSKSIDPKGRTLLIKAIASSSATIMHALCDRACDASMDVRPNAKDPEGNTALHHVSRQPVGLMLELARLKGLDPAASNNRGETPLHFAIVQNAKNIDVIQGLLSWNPAIDVAAKDKKGRTALTYAIEQMGDRAETIWHGQAALNTVMPVLIARTPIDIVDNKGWTALHYAARYGPVTVIDDLLVNGADLNAQDANGWTPLHVAAEHRYQKRDQNVLKSLLRQPPDETLKTKDGFTARQIAANKENHQFLGFYNFAMSLAPASVGDLSRPNIALPAQPNQHSTKYMPSPVPKNTPLHDAVQAGDLEKTEAELAGKGKDDINRPETHGGLTPLHIAAKHGYLDIARALLEAGANPSTHDRLGGMTAKAYAVQNGHADVVELLKSYERPRPQHVPVRPVSATSTNVIDK